MSYDEISLPGIFLIKYALISPAANVKVEVPVLVGSLKSRNLS